MSEPEQDSILIVDDTPANVRILFDYLRLKGYRVLVAENGETALKRVEHVTPDLILLDIMMPEMDGFETCRRLKANKQTSDIPIIFMTALSDTDNKVKGFEMGAVDYITKPVYPEEVLARVETHLTIRKLQGDLKNQNKALQEENVRRKRVQDALKESRMRYRLLAEHSTDMISRQNLEGLYLYVSPACQALLGYAIEEMVGRSFYDFLHPDDEKILRRLWAVVEERPPVSTYTHRTRRKDGSYTWLETVSKLVRDSKTDIPVEIIAVSRDVTERKEAEKALQKAHDELEQRVKERTAELAEANAVLQAEIIERKRVEKERARLMSIQREMEVAHTIQAGLLPPPTPDWSALTVVCYSAPAREVGGDFYAHHAFEPADSQPEKFMLALGDISGKGMPAALLMSVSLASLEAIITRQLNPAQLLVELDRVIGRYTHATRQNCALVCVELTLPPDAPEGPTQAVVANAGCVYPLIKRKGGAVEWVNATGIPLGTNLAPQFTYGEVEVLLHPDDMILLTSDGIIEAMDPDDKLFGFRRLERVVRSGPTTDAQAMLDHLQAEIEGFVGPNREPQDDLTIVIAQI